MSTTFDAEARRAYGDAGLAERIRRANPGVAEPFTSGDVVTPEGTKNSIAGGATGNKVTVDVGGKRFRFWETVRLNRSLDTVDSVELTGPFNPSDPFHRFVFAPFSYHPVSVDVGGARVLTGVSLGPMPDVQADGRTATLSAYSKSGVLGDCSIPASALPFEFFGLNLLQIAKRVCDPFGVEVVFDGDPGSAFEYVTCDVDQDALTFLTTLAQQRGLVIGAGIDGQAVFRSPRVSNTVAAYLTEGEPPLLSVQPFFDPQQYFSHITGIETVIPGVAGSQHTVKNTRLRGVIRPHSFIVQDAVGGDISVATKGKIGRMLANSVNYSVQVATWRDRAGKLWEPGSTVVLHAPGALVYQPYALLVRAVVFEGTPDSETATLDLILPNSFSGEIPERMPWDT